MPSRTPYIFFILTFSLIVWLGGLVGHPQQVMADESNLERKLKAAFILNFAKFTDWQWVNEPENFSICIVGESLPPESFTGLEGKTIAGKSIDLSFIETVEENTPCQLIYFGTGTESTLASSSSILNNLPILVISDIEGSADSGAIIEFINLRKRLGFIINRTKAESSGLQLKSQLLSLATDVL